MQSQYTNTGMYKYRNVQIQECTNTGMYKYRNVQIQVQIQVQVKIHVQIQIRNTGGDSWWCRAGMRLQSRSPESCHSYSAHCRLHITHCTLHIIDMATTVLQAGKIQSCDGRVWPKLTHFTRPGTEDEIYRGCNASILRAISEAKCVIPPPHPPLPRREVALSWGQLEASCHIQQHVLLLFPLPAAGVRLTLTWVPLVGFPPKSPEPGRVVHFLILIWSWLSWHCLPESRLVGCSLLSQGVETFPLLLVLSHPIHIQPTQQTPIKNQPTIVKQQQFQKSSSDKSFLMRIFKNPKE